MGPTGVRLPRRWSRSATGLRRAGSAPVNSAIFEGTVFHRRMVPVRHEFTQRIALRCSTSTRSTRFARTIRCGQSPTERSPVSSLELLRPPQQPLAEAIAIWSRNGQGPAPRARSACSPTSAHGMALQADRLLLVLGCTGQRRQAFVADVTSTPWHGRRAYVLEDPGTERCVDKQLTSRPSCRWTSATESPHRSPTSA